MSIAKPFTFVANTYAKASEVNANFDTVYSQVNTNISNIAQNAIDIDNLETTKADINGDSSEVFAVADPVASSQAVNKQYLVKAIGNSLDYISGLVITKDSGNPNNTIIVSAGSCYDSTHAVVLSLSSSTSKQNLNQGASTTYYVYIIGNSTGSLTDILISTESVTPSLPTGYSLFRKIGSYKTNSSSKISIIYSYGDALNSSQFDNSVLSACINLNYGLNATIPFGNVEVNNIGIVGTNTLTISVSGVYAIFVQAQKGDNRDGADRLELRKNGSSIYTATDDTPLSAVFSIINLVQLSEGDMISLYSSNMNFNSGKLILIRLGGAYE